MQGHLDWLLLFLYDLLKEHEKENKRREVRNCSNWLDAD